MRTFKIIGPNNLFLYCTVAHLGFGPDEIQLETDEPFTVGSISGEGGVATGTSICMSVRTGALSLSSMDRGETDLFRVDPHDLPRLQEARVNWLHGSDYDHTLKVA